MTHKRKGHKSARRSLRQKAPNALREREFLTPTTIERHYDPAEGGESVIEEAIAHSLEVPRRRRANRA